LFYFKIDLELPLRLQHYKCNTLRFNRTRGGKS